MCVAPFSGVKSLSAHITCVYIKESIRSETAFKSQHQITSHTSGSIWVYLGLCIEWTHVAAPFDAHVIRWIEAILAVQRLGGLAVTRPDSDVLG